MNTLDLEDRFMEQVVRGAAFVAGKLVLLKSGEAGCARALRSPTSVPGVESGHHAQHSHAGCAVGADTGAHWEPVAFSQTLDERPDGATVYSVAGELRGRFNSDHPAQHRRGGGEVADSRMASVRSDNGLSGGCPISWALALLGWTPQVEL